ncbi:MAG: BrnT family toxin [Bdellovibrionales bacterium]|nr:BrnT family toxin [Bdellovibrionales bacterium]
MYIAILNLVKISYFNWDQHNEKKCQKHGLSIAMIEAFFLSDPLVTSDNKHSEAEDRYVAFGLYDGRYLVGVFTLRVIEGRFMIRVISARYAKKKEIEALNEKEKSKKSKGK